MRFYVGSSFQNKELVREVVVKLHNLGWHLTYDWTQNERAHTIMDLKRIGTHEKEAT